MDKEAIKEIKQLFETAEDYCKSVEVVFSKGLVIPAINELRYCGKHLLDACSIDDADEELRRAKSHCQRAVYDATEAAALAALETFDQFRERFNQVQICDVISNYQDICQDFLALRKATAAKLEDEEKLDRYESLMQLSKKAMNHLNILDSMEEELKKAQQIKESAVSIERKHLWIGAIGLLVTGFGAAAAFL